MIDTQGNNASGHEEKEVPFSAPPDLPSTQPRALTRVNVVIAVMLLSPFFVLALLNWSKEMLPALFQDSIYIRSLVMNLPGSVAILFLPAKRLYNYIAATGYWLIVSPLVFAMTFMAIIFIVMTFGR